MKRRLYAIYNGLGERVTTFPRETVLDAWHQLAWKQTQGVDEIRQKYEPLGFDCWEVEITKKRKVRAKFPKGVQSSTSEPN